MNRTSTFAPCTCVGVALLVLLSFVAGSSRADNPSTVRAWPAPLALGFEEEVIDPVTKPGGLWAVSSPGWTAEVVSGAAPSGSRFLKLHLSEASAAPFGNVMGRIDATPYRNLRIALRSKVRVEGEGRGQMWLRVDRVDDSMGAFDNMGDRPVIDSRDAAWHPAVIELTVDPDAKWINLGWISVEGRATVMVDDAELVVIGAGPQAQAPSPPRELTPRGLANLRAATKLLGYLRFFHPSDQVVGVREWDRFTIDVIEAAEPATDAEDLALRLSQAIAPLAPTVQVWAGGIEQAPPPTAMPEGTTEVLSWRHFGAGRIGPSTDPIRRSVYSSVLDRNLATSPVSAEALVKAYALKPLDGGVSCRVPLRVFADETRTLPAGATPKKLGERSDGSGLSLTALNRSTRLAAVATAWNVFQHFYPYFDVVQTDWDQALSSALAGGATDVDEGAFLTTLSTLVAQLHDGHGHVSHDATRQRSRAPLAFTWAGDEVVVSGRGDVAPSAIALGDALVAVNGQSLGEFLQGRSSQISAATEGWRRAKLEAWLPSDLRAGPPATLQFRRPTGELYEVGDIVKGDGASVEPAITRPPQGAEVAPGIVYFDLNGTGAEALRATMPKLEAARGLLFDLRGYPDEAAKLLMQHLIDAPAASAQWHIPIITRPDREGWEWKQFGRWNLMPSLPRLRQPVAFLTDGRAISYAESIMGIVEAYRLGEIVGATTAGTNGNVNPFVLPGGYRVYWTGMKVLKHDGSQHHGVGIAPTVPVEPTAAGIAAGRDEVLEKAIDVVRTKLEK